MISAAKRHCGCSARAVQLCADRTQCQLELVADDVGLVGDLQPALEHDGCRLEVTREPQ